MDELGHPYKLVGNKDNPDYFILSCGYTDWDISKDVWQGLFRYKIR